MPRGVKMRELTGERFGKLLVLKRLVDGKGGSCWLCQCDCGAKMEAIGTRLNRGQAQSCGCDRPDTRGLDLTGQRFKRLLVTARAAGSAVDGSRLWLCRCDCGAETMVPAASLRSGNTGSCGCLNRELASKRRVIDLVGQKFNKLLVVERAGFTTQGQVLWRCLCDCGNEAVIAGFRMTRGHTKSCGCRRTELSAELRATHNMAGTPEYVAWCSMRDRCYNENNASYCHYGERGIQVCERWRAAFENFYEDMGPRPEGTSLDRIDPNGYYEKSNCRWATSSEQNRNRRDSVKWTYKGETLSMHDWAERLGINKPKLYMRVYRLGWPIENALENRRPLEAESGNLISEKHKTQMVARRAVRTAVKNGTLIKPPHCQHPDCLASKVSAHHHQGYGKEHHLDVVWLCRKHHCDAEHSVVLTFRGEQKTLAQWADELGISKAALRARLKRPDWSFEEAMSTPKKQKSGPRHQNG